MKKLLFIGLLAAAAALAQIVSMTISAPTFTGTGLNDATSGGVYAGLRANHSYTATICSTGSTDAVAFTSDRGATSGCTVSVSTSPVQMFFTAGTLSGASWSAGVATYTTAAAHQMAVGELVTVNGAAASGYNIAGLAITSVPTSTSFTVAMTANPGTWTSGGIVYCGNGLTIQWAAITGHNTGDQWTVSAGGNAAPPGFIAAGVGAVARSQQAKLRDHISVLDFTTPDGVHSDSPGFAAAMAAVRQSVVFTVAPGGVLEVPPAPNGVCYQWDTQLVIQAFQFFEMRGMGWTPCIHWIGAVQSMVKVFGSFHPHIVNIRFVIDSAHPINGSGMNGAVILVGQNTAVQPSTTTQQLVIEDSFISSGTGSFSIGVLLDGASPDGFADANNDYAQFVRLTVQGFTVSGVTMVGSQGYSHKFISCMFSGYYSGGWGSYGVQALSTYAWDGSGSGGAASFTWDGGGVGASVYDFYISGYTAFPISITNIDDESDGGQLLYANGAPLIITIGGRFSRTNAGTDTDFIHAVNAELTVRNLTANSFIPSSIATSAGTIQATNGSTAIVGTGTSFSASMVGYPIVINNTLSYGIAAVTDATHLTLQQPFLQSSASGLGYSVSAANMTIYYSNGGNPNTIPSLLIAESQIVTDLNTPQQFFTNVGQDFSSYAIASHAMLQWLSGLGRVYLAGNQFYAGQGEIDTLSGRISVTAPQFLLPGTVPYSGYSTGSVTVTEGSTTVTGTGTAWTAAMAGGTFTTGSILYPIASVAGPNSLTLGAPYSASSASGSTYYINYGSSLQIGGGTGAGQSQFEVATPADSALHPVMDTGDSLRGAMLLAESDGGNGSDLCLGSRAGTSITEAFCASGKNGWSRLIPTTLSALSGVPQGAIALVADSTSNVPGAATSGGGSYAAIVASLDGFNWYVVAVPSPLLFNLTAGAGLSITAGSGSVHSGASLTVTNTGVTSINGATGALTGVGKTDSFLTSCSLSQTTGTACTNAGCTTTTTVVTAVSLSCPGGTATYTNGLHQ